MNHAFMGLVGAVAFLSLLGVSSGSEARHAGTADSYLVYIGTFTTHQSKGIYLLRMDAATGKLTAPELVAEAQSPAFLALHPNHHFLYAVNEVDQFHGKPGGGVSAFAIDAASGKLAPLDQQPSAGNAPTHLVVDHAGKAVLVANYNSGSVAVLPIEENGKLAPPSDTDQHAGRGTDPGRQKGPHAHFVTVDPSNRYALSCDLGLDKIFVYRFDPARGKIAPNDPPFATVAPGSGPRHLVFSPDGRRVYVVSEMACTVTAFHYDPDRGTLGEFQTISTLPPNYTGEKSGAEIQMHPSGKFLYVSNRGNANDIAVFAVDPASGALTPTSRASTQGKAPRYFGIDPTGHWLIAANQDTDNLVVFRIDPQTGALQPTGQNISVPTPVCVTFVNP